MDNSEKEMSKLKFAMTRRESSCAARRKRVAPAFSDVELIRWELREAGFLNRLRA